MRDSLSSDHPPAEFAPAVEFNPSTFLSTPSPFTRSDGSAAAERVAGGYFDIRGSGQPSSLQDSTESVALLPMCEPAVAALTALQYLPLPVLVLSSAKTIILGNDAMGRLLGIDLDLQDGGEALSVTDALQGQTMSQLGIDILQGGSPIWINWEVCNINKRFYGVQDTNRVGCRISSTA
jgi:hypothetical protein